MNISRVKFDFNARGQYKGQTIDAYKYTIIDSQAFSSVEAKLPFSVIVNNQSKNYFANFHDVFTITYNTNNNTVESGGYMAAGIDDK